jgi:omega-6 fatty acid desaturase (delta-12 desaturase)
MSKTSLCQYLDTPRFRGSFGRSALVLLETIVLACAWWLFAGTTASWVGSGAKVVLVVCWALIVLRSFMIFHDCGHGSFFQGFPGAVSLNWAALHISSILCGTPTDWNEGHQLHHANLGNIGQDDYDWCETIFHTAAQYVAYPPWKQRLAACVHHPVPFFALAPVLTWWVKMRTPFQIDKAPYRTSNKILNLGFMCARYALARRLGILPLVVCGDYVAMLSGVLIFHWQHVFEEGYVRESDDWSLRDAAMHGSSLLPVPAPLKYFTLGIEYHHVHHFRKRIPGYMLREVHEGGVSLGLWSGVMVLSLPVMWRSLWLQCYDESTGRFSTFREALAIHSAKDKAL